MNHTIRLKFYANNARPALLVYEGDVKFGFLSVNVPDVHLADNEFAAKLYSENKGWAFNLLEKHPEWFVPTHKSVATGFVECPIYALTPTFINHNFEATYDSRSDIYHADPQLFDLHKKYCES